MDTCRTRRDQKSAREPAFEACISSRLCSQEFHTPQRGHLYPCWRRHFGSFGGGHFRIGESLFHNVSNDKRMSRNKLMRRTCAQKKPRPEPGQYSRVKRQRLTVLLAAAPTLAATLLAALARVLLLLTAATLALPAAALLTGLTGLLVLLVVAAALTTLAWLALVRICHTRDSILCCWDHSRRSTRHQAARFRLLSGCRKLEMLRFVAASSIGAAGGFQPTA